MTQIFDYMNPLGDPSVKGTIVLEKKRKAGAGLEYCVYLPPDYDKDKTYPILYHLHGAGQLFSWMKREVLWTAARLEAANIEMIIAAPHDPTFASMWVDGESIDIARQLHEEFIPEIESKYCSSINEKKRIDRSSRFIQGFSMGGFGAALHGFKYQDKFGKILIWDGALHNWDTLTTEMDFIAKNQFGHDREKFDLCSPWAAAKAASDVGAIKKTPVMMFTGRLRQTNRYGMSFKAALLAQGADLTHVETKFSHTLKPFMKAHGKEAFEFLMK
mmetsp:Transcript_14433/g.23866  ORF Transcript_14433/g.23866 Transcript_14433/m.23866 type:complete len:273 (+) Transcript_14433:46-864(+)